MAYRVEIAPAALRDIEEAYLWLREHSPTRADRWFNGLVAEIYTLEEFPTRCPLAAESEELGLELRQLLYGKRGGIYRVLYTVQDAETVRVFRVRHGARDQLRPEDLEPDR